MRNYQVDGIFRDKNDDEELRILEVSEEFVLVEVIREIRYKLTDQRSLGYKATFGITDFDSKNWTYITPKSHNFKTLYERLL